MVPEGDTGHFSFTSVLPGTVDGEQCAGMYVCVRVCMCVCPRGCMCACVCVERMYMCIQVCLHLLYINIKVCAQTTYYGSCEG